MKSLFYQEGINASVSFYDEKKNQLGKFSLPMEEILKTTLHS